MQLFSRETEPRAEPTNLARVRRIYRQIKGTRGISEEELWQHALFFSKSSEERCRISIQTARLALSFKTPPKKPRRRR